MNIDVERWQLVSWYMISILNIRMSHITCNGNMEWSLVPLRNVESKAFLLIFLFFTPTFFFSSWWGNIIFSNVHMAPFSFGFPYLLWYVYNIINDTLIGSLCLSEIYLSLLLHESLFSSNLLLLMSIIYHGLLLFS